MGFLRLGGKELIMAVMEKTRFMAFLETHDQENWNHVLDQLSPGVHSVDLAATRIWFGFWPLELSRALAERGGPAEMARVMDLEGNYRLETQIDSSVEFLYGANYWPDVKKAAVAHAEGAAPGPSLLDHIHEVARGLSAKLHVETSLLTGITAVAFNMLQQVGMEALAKAQDRPATGKRPKESAAAIVGRRAEKHSGVLDFLKGAAREFTVTWDETRDGATFKAKLDQDFATAAATDKRDYRKVDYRRVEGPLPVECRVGSCGYCWVGLLSGRESTSDVSAFEKTRLRYFGYDRAGEPEDRHPVVRLACQTRCLGNVTLVVPPWNGELNRRFDRGVEK